MSHQLDIFDALAQQLTQTKVLLNQILIIYLCH